MATPPDDLTKLHVRLANYLAAQQDFLCGIGAGALKDRAQVAKNIKLYSEFCSRNTNSTVIHPDSGQEEKINIVETLLNQIPGSESEGLLKEYGAKTPKQKIVTTLDAQIAFPADRKLKAEKMAVSQAGGDLAKGNDKDASIDEAARKAAEEAARKAEEEKRNAAAVPPPPPPPLPAGPPFASILPVP